MLALSGSRRHSRPANNAKQTWTNIAHELGYHDQMHMVHDFKLFSGQSPTAFSELFSSKPERWA